MISTVVEAAEQQRISYTRQQDWFDPTAHPNSHVTIVGVGGIGSPTALALAKLGISELTLIDPDTVERHNLPNQMFPLIAEGSGKAEEARDMVEVFAPTQVGAYRAFITEDGWRTPESAVRPEGAGCPGKLHGVVVTGPDNMQARRDLWHTQVKYNPYVPIFLDARMGGQNLLLYSVNPCDADDIAYYEDHLYTDEEARDAPCTAAAVIDVGFAIASLITRAVRKHYAGEDRERMIFLDQRALIFGKE
jgi:hypothetical protein